LGRLNRIRIRNRDRRTLFAHIDLSRSQPYSSFSQWPPRALAGRFCPKLLRCRALPSRRRRWLRAKTREVWNHSLILTVGAIAYLFFVWPDYVFVDEHNRHKRLKGKSDAAWSNLPG
jgi:hypothetical protein